MCYNEIGDNMKKLSIIVPCYNEEDNISLFYEEVLKEIKKLSKRITYEIIFINDGSIDNTLNEIKKLCKNDKNIKYISFSRNFFKEAGIYAGLKNAKGDLVVVMDVDLQDPPSLLKDMLDAIEKENYDICGTRRTTRKGENIIKTIGAKSFYKIINKMSDANITPGARDYRMMTRQVVNSILKISEYNRFSKGIFGWVGFNTKWLEYENIERKKGKSKINIKKLISYAIDGITAFSTTPLIFSSILGLCLMIVAFIAIIIIIAKTLIWGDPVNGWPSLACIILFLSGVQLLSLGIIGEYLSKTYLETKNRPIYIVKESNIDNENN